MAARELRRRPLPAAEPLPPDMKAVLARKYLWYKECLAAAKLGKFLPDKIRSGSAAQGMFQLSAEATDLGQARAELVKLAGSRAVDNLELELYPKVESAPATEPSEVPGGDAFSPF
jgi:hypothetical protein